MTAKERLWICTMRTIWLGMTRQGVHYTLKKAEGILENYEDALGLVAVWKNNNELVAEADSLVEKMQSIDDDAELHGALARMNEILHKALDL